MLELLAKVHGRVVHPRRVRVIADLLASWLPETGEVIDIGCGDGAVAAAILERRPRLRIEGYDVLLRRDTAIPVRQFDGLHLPLPDGAVDAVLLVDVIHHSESPGQLLREAARVARRFVLIKDHRLGYPGAGLLLTFMDWIGNRPHGVRLTYNYWPESRWREAWQTAALRPRQYERHLGLYPYPASWLFDTGLHFAASLEPSAATEHHE